MPKPEPSAAPTCLSESDRKLLYSHASQLWDEIGYDVLSAVAEEKGTHINRVSIPRDEVIELVLDAGRLEALLAQHGHLTPSLKDWLDYRHPYATRVAELKKCFTFTRYGT